MKNRYFLPASELKNVVISIELFKRKNYFKKLENKRMITPGTFSIWAKITIKHDFFYTNQNYIDLQPDLKTAKLLSKLGFLFKKENGSVFMIFKQDSAKKSSSIKRGEVLRFNLTVKDPDFFYYTNDEIETTSEISKITTTCKSGIWKQLEIRIDELTLNQDQFIDVNIKSVSKFFEFIIIPKPESSPQVMKLTEDKNNLIFHPDEIDIFQADQKSVYRFVSTEKIYLKEAYDYKISLWKIEKDGNKKKLFDKIATPNSSAISVINSGDTISSYIYF